MTAIKRKRRNQPSHQRKTQCTQNKRKKPQAVRGRNARSRQVRKHVKNSHGKRGSFKTRSRQLTNKAKGVLGSCVEDFCQAVSSEANRMRKENCESTISRDVLVTALEQSMAKRNIRRSLTSETKKTKKKKQTPVHVTKKTPSPPEEPAAPTKSLPKQRKPTKPPTTPAVNECS